MKRLLTVLCIFCIVLLCLIGCQNAPDSTTIPPTTSTVSQTTPSTTTDAAVTSSTKAEVSTAITTTAEVTTAAPITTEAPVTTTEPTSNYQFTDFTPTEKNSYLDVIGFVIPFLETDYYEIESYDEYGYVGIYYSAECDTKAHFQSYLALYNSYTNDGTDTDDYGDTWYLFTHKGIFLDVCYYEYENTYYVDVDAYFESDGSTDLPEPDDEITDDQELLTNKGAGLPADSGNGIHKIDFTKSDKIKDVTDLGSYLDGCPTVGSPGVLVIPVDFSDITATSRGYSIDTLKKAFLKNGQTDYYSVYDYFYTSSYGKLSLDITIVDSWFRPAKPSSYYASQTIDYYGEETAIGDQMVLDEALDYLDDFMDLSEFDSDNNGIIDSVVLVTTLNISEESDFYWAFRYWNIYTDLEDYYFEYDGVSANDYLWMPFQFLFESYDEDGEAYYTDTSVLNTYTLIHEFSHVLGADDYYDTAYVTDPMGGCDIMDSMTGDHNAFTKFNLGWITESRLVVTDSSITLTLKDFSKTGNTVILAHDWDDALGVYQEYYVIVYYTQSGLNGGDYGYFARNGILVYHINASLYTEDYDGEIYYDIYNNNTDSSDSYGTKDNLIEFVKSTDDNYTYTVGDTLPVVITDQNKTLGYTFTVVSLTDSEATLTFTKK